MLMRNAVILAFSSVAFACDSESEPDKVYETVTVKKVNERIVENDDIIFDKAYGLKCDGSQISGCFVDKTCNNPGGSASYSSNLVYGISKSNIVAYVVSYETGDCSGKFHIHPGSAGIWDYSVDTYNESSGEAEISLSMVYYMDGFLFDSNKPKKNTVYKAKAWVDQTGSVDALCLSDGLLDHKRPLKFMSVELQSIDSSNCVNAIQ